MAKIYLTALRISPQKGENLTVPKVESIESNDIIKQYPKINGSAENTYIKVLKAGGRHTKNYLVAESLGEVYLMQDFNNAASSPYNTGVKATLAPGNGTNKAAGTTAPATGYFTSVTTGSASSTAIALAAASTWEGRAKVIKNAASVAISVFTMGSNLLDGASTNSTVIQPGQFKHFYASASDKIVTCKGPYN